MEKKSTPVLLVGAPIQEGFSMKKLLFAVLLNAALVGCAGYVPGRQSYWDAQVKEMCARDGGVTIYERIHISIAEIDARVLPMTSDGRLSFTTKQLAQPSSPIYALEKILNINEANPRVQRNESIIVRRADEVIVAKVIFYSRVGGDLSTGLSEGTNFSCPNLQKMTTEFHQKLFIIEGESK